MATSVDSDEFCSSLDDTYPSPASRAPREYQKYLGPCLFGPQQLKSSRSACQPQVKFSQLACQPEVQRPRSSGQKGCSRRQVARPAARRIWPTGRPAADELRVNNSGNDSLDLESMVLHGSRLHASPQEAWRVPPCPQQSAEDSLLTTEESFPFEGLPEPFARQESAEEPRQWHEGEPEPGSIASGGAEVVSENSGLLSPASGNKSQLASFQEQPEQKSQRQLEMTWSSVVAAEPESVPKLAGPLNSTFVNTTQLVFLGNRSLSASQRGRLGTSAHPPGRSVSTSALHYRTSETSQGCATSSCVCESTSLTIRGTQMANETLFEPVTVQASTDHCSPTARMGWTKLENLQPVRAHSSICLDHAKLVKHAPPLGCSLEQVLFERRHISVKACNGVSSRPSTPSPGIPWRPQSQQQSAQALQELELVRSRRPSTPTLESTRPLAKLTRRLQNEGPELAAMCD
eukprot:TRINITY_DN27404_c0_g1_i1.p1 TRINITY_DN27404_c0_g1~~TRINITY_DN27404_c0_g1_i1.p1  ORF type:complete len:460 (-),score=52.29 TRINITY_DN27404_c0_g1_i1:82-1461(-)